MASKAIQPSMPMFFDEADARGTWFSEHPMLSTLVDQIEQWSSRGMSMDEIDWLAAPAQVVEFERPQDGFFPSGFLGQMEILEEGKVQLFLWSRRVDAAYGDVDEQMKKWTRKCFQSIVHFYRVLRPLQVSSILVVSLCPPSTF